MLADTVQRNIHEGKRSRTEATFNHGNSTDLVDACHQGEFH
jgi:hypothetical protein